MFLKIFVVVRLFSNFIQNFYCNNITIFDKIRCEKNASTSFGFPNALMLVA